jgi:hypothetical protein
MNDLLGAMFVAALCAVLLVTGQQYLLKTPELAAANASPHLQHSANKISP